MPFLSLILFPARIVPDGRRQGAAFGLSLDGEAELAERLFENFHTGGSGKSGLPLMPARTFSPMARIAMALAFLKPSQIRWSMGFIPF